MVQTISRVPSVRAEILTRRTYARPLNDEGTLFETWPQIINRVKGHQQWLWERAQGGALSQKQIVELDELTELMLNRTVSLAGRTLWLGGTELIKRREISSFNCTATEIRTIHDIVDGFWCLLNGAGLGFKPVNGTLSGFTKKMHTEFVRSTRTDRGRENNIETFDQATKVWTINVGDSAEAWAKAVGKLIAGKFPAKTLVIDLSQVRPEGSRLKGYGWISAGDNSFYKALEAICTIMNRQACKLLTKIDILDIVNWLGTVLSSRRSAQICLVEYGDPEWETFATAKSKENLKIHWHRCQSNNSLVFLEPPTRKQLKDLFDLIVESGGSEPGFVNGQQLKKRAPYASLLNPCSEIELPSSGGTCNLVELDVASWKNDHLGMHKAMRLLARANYRQTMVNLRDGILQDAWHQNNEFLRLCGVGITGIIRRPDLMPYDFRQLRNTAVAGAYEQAHEFGTERPKNVTTIKPSGTLSKAVFDTTEGAHRPQARYIFNDVIFSRHDKTVQKLLDANYNIYDHPNDPGAVIVTLPVSYPDVDFDLYNGHEVDRESAVAQLNRYKMLQDNYVDQNTSITISYAPEEVKSMVDWFMKNWDCYVATSFLFRNDVTKTAADLGYGYLPQNCVTKAKYDNYMANLKPLDFSDNSGCIDNPLEDGCALGCPVR